MQCKNGSHIKKPHQPNTVTIIHICNVMSFLLLFSYACGISQAHCGRSSKGHVVIVIPWTNHTKMRGIQKLCGYETMQLRMT